MSKHKRKLAAIDGLDNEKRVRILGVIDKIRELGVNENVSLPQLVVVGDQSSGKSSLLEGLTGLSFPVASELCTRFATQIVLRRAPAKDAKFRVTIITGPSSQGDAKTKASLDDYKIELEVDKFDTTELQKIFHQVAARMGVPGPSTKNLDKFEKRFSDDILKIELSGPDHHHLSVVDVPGLFHNATKYQTDEDRAIIRQLIEGYITDKRTIIMAVMDARNNLANQEVFSMARAADPAGKRTVGIITKCDALQPGDEDGVLRIANNEVERLTHGWFAVKNRSTQEITSGVTIEGRHEREKHFFATTSPWTKLKKDRVGIDALKIFLGQLLYQHVTNEFPGVIVDIKGLWSSTQQELELLGPSRQTSVEQRRFLTRIANTYQQDVGYALSGNYDPDIEPTSALKLRMHVRKLNDDFASSMTHDGHVRMFLTVEGLVDEEFDRTGDLGGDILKWIRETYRDSRGAELPGTVNPVVLENMFRQQSSPWEGIATNYIDGVVKAVRQFNKAKLALLLPDGDLREKLAYRLSQSESTANDRAREQLRTVLTDERGGILQTVNHYFADTLTSIREARVHARLKATGFTDGTAFYTDKFMQKIHLSNEDQAVNDIHDIMKAYYKVALKRFSDNVVLQVAERHLLGTGGPVKTLSPDMIGELQDAELADIAGENFATSSARNELTTRCERLQKALDIAKEACM